MKEGSPFQWIKKAAGIVALGTALHGAPDAAHGEPTQPPPAEKNHLTDIIDYTENDGAPRNPNILPKSILDAYKAKDAVKTPAQKDKEFEDAVD